MRTKEIKIIHDFGYCHNHAQFSPVRPDLFILDEDGSRDPVSGRLIIYNTRMWLLNTNCEERMPVNPTQWYYKNSWMCHDFWSGDGTACWIDYKKKVHMK